MELERILCPTDFSDASAHAVEQAVVIGGYYKSGITALHVVQPVEPSLETLSVENLKQETAAFVGGAVAAGLAVDVRVETGLPANHIVECASRLAAGLIVMGTHGSSGFEHLILGSVTEKVLRKAPCPVLTVPPRAHTESRLPLRRVLCAVDLSDASRAAARFAASMAQESGAGLTLLHVLEWPWHEPPAPPLDELPPEQAFALATFRRDAEERARMRLESMASAMGRPPDVDVRIASGKPYEQILEVARTGSADLIVIGVNQRNVLSLVVLGSTANHVIRAATCPVLTLHQGGGPRPRKQAPAAS
jgi:nucleotide-binding universal stress UspA family protein